ncbi:MAG: hypothetical protein ACI94Y_003753 [Maribacter sp.]|jgi:uncharacterized protein RhaS with RHS repeats
MQNVQDYGFRLYNPSIGKFLSVDPLSPKYPELTPYQFASNTPIQAIDLDGLEAYYVHGTWSSPETFSAFDLENDKTIKEIFGNETIVDNFEWGDGGKNLDKYRQSGAKKLVAEIKASVEDGEPITIVGHSHGGNVSIIAVNLMMQDEFFDDKEINLVTINTPVREYQLNADAKGRVDHYNIYDTGDPVQSGGGNDPDKFVRGGTYGGLFTKKQRIEEGDRAGKLMTGEFGDAGRTFEGAINIKTSKVHWNPLGGAHNSHNLIDEWKEELQKGYNKKNDIGTSSEGGTTSPPPTPTP